MIDAKTENLVPMPASPTFSSKDLMNNARVRWIALVVVVLVVLGRISEPRIYRRGTRQRKAYFPLGFKSVSCDPIWTANARKHDQ